MPDYQAHEFHHFMRNGHANFFGLYGSLPGERQVNSQRGSKSTNCTSNYCPRGPGDFSRVAIKK